MTPEGPVFSLYPLRLQFIAGRAIRIQQGTAANLVRGQLGKSLRREDAAAYDRYFAPAEEGGPSGFRNPPRPFVLRVAELEGARFEEGEPFEIGVNLFETKEASVNLFREVLTRVGFETFGARKLERAEGLEPLELSLAPATESVSHVRVFFRTPTELKNAGDPEFGVLVARIRDRVSLLRSLYGNGPLEVDFRGMGERAARVAMTRCDLQWESTERYSRSQEAAHPLGGFTGIAEYEGELAEFLPYLEAAAWTGVGRQTVWGKGEIRMERLKG